VTRTNTQTTPSHLDLCEMIEAFGSEPKCHAYLEGLRWPEGVKCPRCSSEKISRIIERKQFDCDACRYQFSVRVNTILHDSHLPLWKWFLAVYMMIQSRKGVSANQLKRTLGVSYKTAWYLCHRIRKAMAEMNAMKLGGTVEVDETYIGGKNRGKGTSARLENKTMVLGAVERGGRIRLRVEKRADRKTLRKFIDENVGGWAQNIYTDEWKAYGNMSDFDTQHETVDHSKEEWVRGDVHTNSVEGVWSLFKRSIIGSYHQVSAKHLDAYLDEFEWRFNNRKNPYLFCDTLLKLIESESLPYEQLTA
jgi:transposase-like protein